MTYGILLWGNTVDINRPFVLLIRAVRAIYEIGPRVSRRDKFKEIKITTLALQYIQENVIYVKNNTELFF